MSGERRPIERLGLPCPGCGETGTVIMAAYGSGRVYACRTVAEACRIDTFDAEGRVLTVKTGSADDSTR